MSEDARVNAFDAWLRGAKTDQVASYVLTGSTGAVDIDMALARIMAGEMSINGDAGDFVAVRLTIAEVSGRNPINFHGDIKRGDVEKFAVWFCENVARFRASTGGWFKAVDDGKA